MSAVITKVVHGRRVGGLIAYLMGPGRAQEHVRPRVIASWDGRDAGWQPSSSASGTPELGPLIRAVRAPVVAAGLPETGDDGRRGHVWHCSVRVAGSDRVLSDEQWASIARELLDASGVAAKDDAGGPRWVAIRHDDDHIHIAVVLVRQDTSRRFWPSRDYPRLRAAARRIEKRLGLTETAGADGTAASTPGRGETEKAARAGRSPARTELARTVRSAAVAAGNAAEFVAELRRAGVLFELRRAPSGDLLGYKVALPGDVNGDGAPVYYSGSKLAPDLSLPRLMRSWRETASGSEAADPVTAGRRRVDGARSVVATARRGELGEDPDGVVHATADVLGAVGPWSPGLREAGERFDRAARAPRGSTVTTGPTSAGLRRLARRLVRRPPRWGAPDETEAGVALVVALAALLSEVAAWQRELGRVHQAAAAHEAAESIGPWAGDHGSARIGTPVALGPDHAAASPGPRKGRSPRRASGRPRG